MSVSEVYTGTCGTMTFEEAWKAITTGKPFTAVLRQEIDGHVAMAPVFSIEASDDTILLATAGVTLYWTADGISSVEPSSN